MTHPLCPRCRARFAPLATPHLDDCPACGEPLQAARRSADAIGFALYEPPLLIDAPAGALVGASPRAQRPTGSS